MRQGRQSHQSKTQQCKRLYSGSCPRPLVGPHYFTERNRRYSIQRNALTGSSLALETRKILLVAEKCNVKSKEIAIHVIKERVNFERVHSEMLDSATTRSVGRGL